MGEILKVLGPDDEERDEWKAPENDLRKNGLEMDPEEETRRFIEKEKTKRERFKKAVSAFGREMEYSGAMYYDLTPDEQEEMMQKMLDTHKHYSNLAYQNTEKRRKGGIDNMNIRPR